jgi:hypothetical protein
MMADENNQAPEAGQDALEAVLREASPVVRNRAAVVEHDEGEPVLHEPR